MSFPYITKKRVIFKWLFENKKS